MKNRGFTLVEVMISVVVLAIVVLGFMGLLTVLVNSSSFSRQKNEALILASNKIEAIKAEAYEDLTPYQTINETSTVDNLKYTVTTYISYVDNAYDGCGSYPTQAAKEKYCLNYANSPNAGNNDTNPADYKEVDVSVKRGSTVLASLSTMIASHVSETASATGALFVTVITPSGTPIGGATVEVKNSTLSPAFDGTGVTDSNGVKIFYGLPPDSGDDYVISASLNGYSSLSTIGAGGSLVPTYANQNILTQSSSYVTLKLVPQGQYSLLMEAQTPTGTPVSGLKVFVKGGYKMYTDTSDTSYYYNDWQPTDNRPTTDASGLTVLTNLVPINQYIFCGDNGDQGCATSGSTYYLAAAVPYGGDTSLMPVSVPAYDSSRPATTYNYGGNNYLQKVRLIVTTDSAFPRVFSIAPDSLSASDPNVGNFNLSVTGQNISSASLTLVQGTTSYVGGGCTSSGNQRTCNFDLSGIANSPNLQLVVTNGDGTLTLPVGSPKGGLIVTP